jgi:hypothetical protein
MEDITARKQTERRLQEGIFAYPLEKVYSPEDLPLVSPLSSLKHLMCLHEHCRRDRHIDLLGNFEVEHQFQLHWTLNG